MSIKLPVNLIVLVLLAVALLLLFGFAVVHVIHPTWHMLVAGTDVVSHSH